MGVTLVLLGQSVDLAAMPGIHRLSGLMTLIGVSFAVPLAISKTRIWLFFGGAIFLLFAIATVAFLFMQWGSRALLRRRDEPKEDPPVFMDELGRRRERCSGSVSGIAAPIVSC
jgi:hypothetical protein